MNKQHDNQEAALSPDSGIVKRLLSWLRRTWQRQYLIFQSLFRHLSSSLRFSLFRQNERLPLPVEPKFSRSNGRALDHFVYPAESSAHLATILMFPSTRSMPKDLLPGSRAEIAALANAIAEFEPVRLHAREEDLAEARKALLSAPGAPTYEISLVSCPGHHPWVRDCGPIYVKPGSTLDGDDTNVQRYALDFGFCEWGGKAPTGEGDSVNIWGQTWPVLSKHEIEENTLHASRIVAADMKPSKAHLIRAPISLEGGALSHDGDGTLVATESSIICPVRNPGWSKEALEAEMRRLLGVKKIIWLKGSRGIDITDAHVDDHVRFVRPGVVIALRSEEDHGDGWYEVYEDVRQVLATATDARGRQLEVHWVDEPNAQAVSSDESEEPQASYMNFHFVNGGIIMPIFGDAMHDARAIRLIKELFPERRCRPLHINALPLAGGGIHCVTQQVPA